MWSSKVFNNMEWGHLQNLYLSAIFTFYNLFFCEKRNSPKIFNSLLKNSEHCHNKIKTVLMTTRMRNHSIQNPLLINILIVYFTNSNDILNLLPFLLFSNTCSDVKF